ncbi:MAG: hypothetical protein NTV32_00130, partial [Gammaproteobacteria bacterium]|nr:hypothetical protein [Gammaproteobacteria bacterium]
NKPQGQTLTIASDNLIFDYFTQKPCQAFYALFSYLFYAAFRNGESLLFFLDLSRTIFNHFMIGLGLEIA